MSSIKNLKSGEFKCAVCDIKFSTRELALKHLKTTQHLKTKATQEKKQVTKSIIHFEDDIPEQPTDLQVFGTKLDLILQKMDLLSERTTRLEIRLQNFEDKFENSVTKPRNSTQKLQETVNTDKILQDQLNEVKQIELAEKLIRQKVENLQKQKSYMPVQVSVGPYQSKQSNYYSGNFQQQQQSPSCKVCGSFIE
ncbi:Conserved_hypothetical protein [Hexamita inflata]|uniref:C2H2-type domain-containing protein n=1 Tax=Hexamita inflata TaxID=28002 RepID=A0AA86TKV3_9EUKA|nr:Conserved hypothetical protein [Hexamita inflata]CAI9947380.1 Conserved hypothetical protein [Hexamita inflata]